MEAGVVVASLKGEILWDVQAWMETMRRSTDVLEAKAVVEACRVVVHHVQAHEGSVCLAFAFFDKQAAAQHQHTKNRPTMEAASCIAQCATFKS